MERQNRKKVKPNELKKNRKVLKKIKRRGGGQMEEKFSRFDLAFEGGGGDEEFGRGRGGVREGEFLRAQEAFAAFRAAVTALYGGCGGGDGDGFGSADGRATRRERPTTRYPRGVLPHIHFLLLLLPLFPSALFPLPRLPLRPHRRPHVRRRRYVTEVLFPHQSRKIIIRSITIALYQIEKETQNGKPTLHP